MTQILKRDKDQRQQSQKTTDEQQKPVEVKGSQLVNRSCATCGIRIDSRQWLKFSTGKGEIQKQIYYYSEQICEVISFVVHSGSQSVHIGNYF